MKDAAIVDPCHCHALRKAARSITHFYDAALAPSGLRQTQFSMLVLLSERRGRALGELADQLGLERTTATRNLKLLERMGYVAIGPAEDDGRRKAIRLTSAGTAIRARAAPLWQEAQRDFEAKYPGGLIGRLRAILHELDEPPEPSEARRGH